MVYGLLTGCELVQHGASQNIWIAPSGRLGQLINSAPHCYQTGWWAKVKTFCCISTPASRPYATYPTSEKHYSWCWLDWIDQNAGTHRDIHFPMDPHQWGLHCRPLLQVFEWLAGKKLLPPQRDAKLFRKNISVGCTGGSGSKQSWCWVSCRICLSRTSPGSLSDWILGLQYLLNDQSDHGCC